MDLGNKRWLGRWGWIIAAALAGCGRDPSATVPTEPVTPAITKAATPKPSADTTVPDGTPEQLLAFLEKAMVVKSPGEDPKVRQQAVMQAFKTVIAAADKVLAHPKATADQKERANEYKIAVLFEGTRGFDPESVKRLESFAKEIKEKTPKSPNAALAAYYLIGAKYGDPETRLPKIEALPAIEQFVKDFPTDPSGGFLLENVAIAAEHAKKPDASKKAYELLLKHFPKHEKAESAKGALLRFGLVGKPIELTGTTFENKPFDIKSLKGKVVLVHFWSKDFEPRVRSVATLMSLYKRLHDQGLEIVGIPVDTDLESLKATLAQAKIPWPQLLSADSKTQADNPLAKRFGIQIVPTLFLVDRKGTVVAVQVPTDQLEAALDRELKKSK